MAGIDTERIIWKLDSLLDRKDYEGSEKLLDYWLAEAIALGDARSELSLRNEAMGLARKLGKKEKAFENGERACALASLLGMENTVTGGTTFLNYATVLKAFGMAGQALDFYEKAEKTYLTVLEEGDVRFGGLYNNRALALADCGMYMEAEECYKKALSVMENAEGGEPERAVTLLNMADNEVMSCGRKVNRTALDYVAKARELLEAAKKRDGNYAFVCEKCAPVFGYYGMSGYEEELKARAEEIYGNG